MTDSDLPTTFDPDAGDDLASWPVTPDAAAAPVCPWCSAALPAPDAEACPSCGASLAGAEEVQVPGVTTIDPMTALRTRSQARSRPRRNVLGWITGDSELRPTYDDPLAAIPPAILPPGAAAPSPMPPGRPSPEALAPPDRRVRREMLRMELAAIGLELPEDDAKNEDEGGPDEADPGPRTEDTSDSPGA